MDACAVRSGEAGDGVERRFSSVFSAIAEPSDTETSGNLPEDAAPQQPVALVAQIVQHLLTVLQGRSQLPPGTGYATLLYFPIPFHPAGVINGVYANNIGD